MPCCMDRKLITDVFADAGYQGVAKQGDATGAAWHVAMRPGVRQHLKRHLLDGKLLHTVDRLNAAARAKVNHRFHIVKNRFGPTNVRYRGLATSAAQHFTLFGPLNY